MHGHFSRLRFDELDRFSAVVALQGRVTVEADHNEHVAILQHYLRTLATDVLGRHAWPSAAPDGFKVTPEFENAVLTDFSIAQGRCYVDGILVENPVDVTYYSQPDARFTSDVHSPPTKYPFYVYMEVWERLVTFVEQPEIRDSAFGARGPDSSARTKVVWQIRVGETLSTPPALPNDRKAALSYWDANEADLVGLPKAQGGLKASLGASTEDELCALSPAAGYRGLENQLYRVEVHSAGTLLPAPSDAGGPVPTFKWSRDNGSVVFPIKRYQGSSVEVTTLGKDDRYALNLGDWVEFVDDATVLNGDPPLSLRKVVGIDPVELRVTLDAAPPGPRGGPAYRDPHPLLRRWDQQPTGKQLATDNAIPITASSVPLEDGIEVTFEPGSFHAEDFWVIPARVERGDIEWPSDGSGARSLPPKGVKRSYVPLAYVKSPSAVYDLRLVVNPLQPVQPAP